MLYIQYAADITCVDLKTEADSGDANECPRDDLQSTGMLAVSNTILIVVICLRDICTSTLSPAVVLFTFTSSILHIRARASITC